MIVRTMCKLNRTSVGMLIIDLTTDVNTGGSPTPAPGFVCSRIKRKYDLGEMTAPQFILKVSDIKCKQLFQKDRHDENINMPSKWILAGVQEWWRGSGSDLHGVSSHGKTENGFCEEICSMVLLCYQHEQNKRAKTRRVKLCVPGQPALWTES